MKLKRLNGSKAAGSDCVSPRVLKITKEELFGILQHVKLSQEKIPVLWMKKNAVEVMKHNGQYCTPST